MPRGGGREGAGRGVSTQGGRPPRSGNDISQSLIASFRAFLFSANKRAACYAGKQVGGPVDVPPGIAMTVYIRPLDSW